MHAGSWVVRTIGQCCFKYHYPDCNTSFSEGYTAADGVVNLVIKNDLFEPFIYKTRSFYQDRLGKKENHRERKHSKTGWRFVHRGRRRSLCLRND